MSSSDRRANNRANGVSLGIFVNVHLDDVLSPATCSTVISDVIKYIVCHKGQIPYTYEHLKNVTKNVCPVDAKPTSNQMCPSMVIQQKHLIKEGRKNKLAIQALCALESMFENLGRELEANCNGVKEVVVLMGSTPMTPQEIYTIVVPPLAIGRCERPSAYRKSLLTIIRCFVSSEELNDMLAHPLATTNTYVYLKKNKSSEKSDWFLPKDRYNLPARGKHVTISLSPAKQGLNSSSSIINVINPASTSNCGFMIHQDDDKEILPNRNFPSRINPCRALQDTNICTASALVPNNHECLPCEDLQWYQSPLVLKGFKCF